MKSQDVKRIVSKLPDEPGVYYFKQKSGGVLYIGKATSLRDRVRSYFSSDIFSTRGPLISKMLEEFDNIDFQKTDSVLEALILEAHLIKKYQPYYNTKEKSDKSFNFVVITKENFPRVLIVRERDFLQTHTNLQINTNLQMSTNKKLKDVSYSFGPFPNAGVLREALVLTRKIFPFRDKCLPFVTKVAKDGLCHNKDRPWQSPKPCFNRQIGLCPGVCTGEISKEEYRETIKNIVRFFRGEKKLIIKDLQKRMKMLAKAHEFEKAGELKRQIFALNHIHDISLIKSDFTKDYRLRTNDFRIEAYDVAHFAGREVVGVMTVVENGTPNKNEYRKFKIKENPGINDTKALKEILRRRFGHDEWQLPNLIVVDGGVAQRNAALNVLTEFGYQIPIVAVTKNEYHKPKNILGLPILQAQAGDRAYLQKETDILLANSEAHRFGVAYHRKMRTRRGPSQT